MNKIAVRNIAAAGVLAVGLAVGGESAAQAYPHYTETYPTYTMCNYAKNEQAKIGHKIVQTCTLAPNGVNYYFIWMY